MYFSLFDWNDVYFGDYSGKIISISDIVTVDLLPLFLHEHIFVLNFNVTSEQFQSGLLIFSVLYYSYDFSFSDHFFHVFIFRIYRELTWHFYLIYLINLFLP